MPNYYFASKNPITRAAAIRAFFRRGYALYGSWTISDYFKKWPSETWPIVVARTDGVFAKNPAIDLGTDTSNKVFRGAIKLASLKQINELPIIHPNTPDFPAAAKYVIEYQKVDGSVQNYTISNPIEDNGNLFTAYSFGSGIRSFTRNKVRSFSKVS